MGEGLFRDMQARSIRSLVDAVSSSRLLKLFQLHAHASHYSLPVGTFQQGPSPPPVYQLVAISHHSGSLEGGHYTASARAASDGSWYSFNDSSVRRDAKPGGASSSAYVLVYRLAARHT